MAAKRADYLEAGTLVVWDVDPIAESVHVYRAAAPDQPKVTRAARRLTRNRSCPVGGSPSTGSSPIESLLSRMTHGSGCMSQIVVIEMEIPDDLARLRLPPGVQDRLQALLDRQNEGTALHNGGAAGSRGPGEPGRSLVAAPTPL